VKLLHFFPVRCWGEAVYAVSEPPSIQQPSSAAVTCLDPDSSGNMCGSLTLLDYSDDRSVAKQSNVLLHVHRVQNGNGKLGPGMSTCEETLFVKLISFSDLRTQVQSEIRENLLLNF
jgi:hypothetical protein